MTCTVDARWLWSDNIGLSYQRNKGASYNGKYYVTGKWPEPSPPDSFPWSEYTVPARGSVEMSMD